MSPIARRLQEIRQRLGFAKRSQMAEKLGIPASTYNAYESIGGPPKIEWLVELAKLGVNTNWLLLGEGEPLINQETVRTVDNPMGEIDPLLLAAMINAVEREQRTGQADPLVRARLIARLYANILRQTKLDLTALENSPTDPSAE